MRHSLRWATITGLLAGLVALLFSWVLLKGSSQDWGVMIYASAIAALILGTALWWLIVGRANNRLILRGFIAGALVGLFSHPVAWYLSILVLYLSGTKSSLGEPTLDPIQGVWSALVSSFMSLILFGWMTITIGAFLGGILGYLQSRSQGPPIRQMEELQKRALR